MYKLLIYVFGMSYIIIKNVNNNNFCQWSKSKNTFNLLINKKILNWVKSNNTKESSLCNQYIIDCIIEMIFIHYRLRVSIYKILNKFLVSNRNLFITFSIIFLFFGLFGKLLRELFSFIYKYKSDAPITNIINLSLNFPQHAFSITNKKNISFFYSFGEYLEAKHSENLLVSIGEYQRHSKKFEKKNVTSEVSKFKRKTPTKQRNFIKFIPKILHAFSLLLKDNAINNNIFFKLIYYRKFFYKINFMNMLSDINIELKNIGNIFTLPVADIGLLKYDNKFLEKITAFNYSQNSLIMPSPNLDNIYKQKKFLEYMPLYLLSLSENSYGFTSTYSSINKIKQKLNNEFCLNFFIKKNIPDEVPVTLGYEKMNFIAIDQKKLKKQKVISIFDVSPDSYYNQLSRTTNGDKINGYDFVENFMIETVKTSIDNGFAVIIKPKYSLYNHNNYKNHYSDILKTIKKKYEDKLIIADPYVRLDTIVKFSCASINMPYTSTKIIFEKNNIPSIYYVPKKYKQNFKINNDSSIRYGLSSLTLFIKQIN